MQQLLLCVAGTVLEPARNRLGPWGLLKKKSVCVTFHRGMVYVTFHRGVGGSLGVLWRHNDQQLDRGS